jgi:hypothetical protein
MDRTSGANNIDIGGGRRGHRDRNTAAGLAGTRLTAAFLNGLQEEALALIEGMGLTPSDADLQQVWQAVRRLSGRQIRVLTGNATLTADDGLVIVSAAGGNVALTLPAANALAGTVAGVARISAQQLMILRTDTSGNTLTLNRAGSDKLGAGTATAYLMGVGERLRILSDGVDTWHLVSSTLSGRRRQVFNADGTFTVPAWVDWVDVEAIGGGGGGGGNTTRGGAGGGGGAGYARGRVAVTGGQVITVTRGAGGAAGSASSGSAAGNDGGNGGASSFGSAVVAGGGLGGKGSLIDGSGATGEGGAGTTGEILMTGQDGNAGIWISGGLGLGGMGGMAARGGGGGAASSGLPTPGNGPGGGGGGGGSNFGGAAGANGAVYVVF